MICLVFDSCDDIDEFLMKEFRCILDKFHKIAFLACKNQAFSALQHATKDQEVKSALLHHPREGQAV